MKNKVSKILMELGIQTNLLGYEYLREAIMKCYNDRDYLRGITKALYPEVAKVFNTTASRAERAMRHAIEVAYDKYNEAFSNLFGEDYYKAPSNSLFISEVIEKRLILEDSEKVHRHYDCSPSKTVSEDKEECSSERQSSSFESEIKKLKDHIVELRISAISNSIPQGHCPYAYYYIKDDDNYCEDGDCFTCRNQFLAKMTAKIKKEVYSPDYLE